MRKYDLALPYQLSSWGLSFLIEKLDRNNLWDVLPEDLAKKIREAKDTWNGLVIEQADLDKIPDESWNLLREKIGI